MSFFFLNISKLVTGTNLNWNQIIGVSIKKNADITNKLLKTVKEKNGTNVFSAKAIANTLAQ